MITSFICACCAICVLILLVLKNLSLKNWLYIFVLGWLFFAASVGAEISFIETNNQHNKILKKLGIGVVFEGNTYTIIENKKEEDK